MAREIAIQLGCSYAYVAYTQPTSSVDINYTGM